MRWYLISFGPARLGTDMYEDSWFQLEGAAWRPFRHPIDAVRHGFNFMQYKLRQSQVSWVHAKTVFSVNPVVLLYKTAMYVSP